MSPSGAEVTTPTSRAPSAGARPPVTAPTATPRSARRAWRWAPALSAGSAARCPSGAAPSFTVSAPSAPISSGVARLPVREESEAVVARVVGDDRRYRTDAARDDCVGERRERGDGIGTRECCAPDQLLVGGRGEHRIAATDEIQVAVASEERTRAERVVGAERGERGNGGRHLRAPTPARARGRVAPTPCARRVREGRPRRDTRCTEQPARRQCSRDEPAASASVNTYGTRRRGDQRGRHAL